MNLPTIWQQLLSARSVPKYLLLTLDLAGRDPSPSGAAHLALQPGALRYATNLGAYVLSASGRTVPFLPYLTTWPAIAQTLAIQDRTAEMAEPSFEILASSGLAATLRDRGGALGLTARVDLWCRRTTLEQSIPLLAGVVTDAKVDRRTSGVTLTIADGDPNRAIPWPPGPITLADFPEAPDSVIDVESRTTVSGGDPDNLQWINCIQIDREGRRFYVCDPAGTSGPTIVEKDGEAIETGWHVEVRETSGPSLFEYREIVFDSPVSDLANGINPWIRAYGVIGITNVDPISFYAQVAGLPLSPQAQASLADYFADPRMRLQIVNDQSGNALDIIRTRLVPQTPFAWTQHLGQADLIDLRTPASGYKMGIGNGLLFRTTVQAAQTPSESVFNAFELLCGEAGSQYRIRRDKNYASAAIASLLTRSEQANGGRRFLQVPLPDVTVQMDENLSPIGCVAGEALADMYARLHAVSHVSHTYQATWLDGLQAELGDYVLLTDSDEDYDDQPTVIVGRAITATGPQLTFAMVEV